MKTYHKIQTVFLRDMDSQRRKKPVIVGKYSKPEFDFLKDNEWTCTEKIDGTNVRVIWCNGWVEFKGKNEHSQMQVSLIDKLREIFTEDKMNRVFGPQEEEDGGVCLYGEGFGGRIKKVGPKYGDIDFILFDIKIGNWWLERKAVDEIAKSLGIRSVPVAFKGTLRDAIYLVMKGFYSLVSKEELIAEGLICEPSIQLFNRKGERVITKIKYKDFFK